MNDLVHSIKPISDLANYSKLLNKIKPHQPIILTKNGYAKFAVLKLSDYQKLNKIKSKFYENK